MNIFDKKKKGEANIYPSTSNYFVSVDESLVSYARERIEKLLDEKEKEIVEKHPSELMASK